MAKLLSTMTLYKAFMLESCNLAFQDHVQVSHLKFKSRLAIVENGIASKTWIAFSI